MLSSANTVVTDILAMQDFETAASKLDWMVFLTGMLKRDNFRCVCNHLGTNASAGACDRVTGQCPCFPNVVGQECDECAPQHFNIASGKGCLACACDPQGVVPNADGYADLECNRLDGQCHCKAGRGGRTCSECQDLYWGDPVNGECLSCQCNRHGSLSLQCHRNNGTCICRPGSGGPLCDQCSRGYTGVWPQCQVNIDIVHYPSYLSRVESVSTSKQAFKYLRTRPDLSQNRFLAGTKFCKNFAGNLTV